MDYFQRADFKRYTATFNLWKNDFKGKILEIGPLDKPIFCKDNFNVKYVDYFNKNELAEKIKTNPNRDISNIVDLDYVLAGQTLNEVISEKFDIIVASHVLEHLPNLIGWLKQIESILEMEGEIFAIIPDKRYIFDIDRPITTLGTIIENYQTNRQKPSLGSVFDQRFYHKNVKASLLWDDYQNCSSLEKTFDFKQSLSLMHKAKSSYIDCHCNVFDCSTFIEYMNILQQENIINFNLSKIAHTVKPFIDFIVLLSKNG